MQVAARARRGTSNGSRDIDFKPFHSTGVHSGSESVATTGGIHDGFDNKLSDTSQLPLSPLLDPNLLAARNRYKVPKPEPDGELSAFQKKLRKNPYAQALATPVRQCAVTGSRLPKFFLLDFGLSPHPKTGKPWQIPKLAIATDAGSSSDVSTLGTIEENELINDPAIEAAVTTRRSARTAAGSHIVAQQSAMRMVSTLKHKSYMQILPQRWKLDARFKSDHIVWRKDMDTFVLDLMRKRATKTLKYLSSQPAAYIVPCQDYESIQDRHQPGAVLWLGQHEGNGTAMLSKEDPPPYAMVDCETRKRPSEAHL
ncbi:MAG: hypothetical protein Q9209_007011 [Squamulea sp. 1 TL-2023]